jgi:hypothetical protein
MISPHVLDRLASLKDLLEFPAANFLVSLSLDPCEIGLSLACHRGHDSSYSMKENYSVMQSGSGVISSVGGERSETCETHPRSDHFRFNIGQKAIVSL